MIEVRKTWSQVESIHHELGLEAGDSKDLDGLR
jgi:hypothetical protein